MMKLIGEKREGKEGSFGTITLTGLETLTEKGLTENYVIKLNEKLTGMYKHVVVSYGFQDFHSLYLFALSNTQEELYKSNPKDYTSMSKVRRTVVRNGRRTAITFYENTKGLDNKQKVGGNKKSEPTTVSPASELVILAQGDQEEPIPIKELHAINKIIEGFVVVGEFENLDRVKLYLDEEMQPKAVQGLRVEGEYLTMPFRATDGNVQGFYQRAFYEMVKVALNWGLGVKLIKDETKLQAILAESSELKDTGGMYLSSYEELLEKYGELP